MGGPDSSLSGPPGIRCDYLRNRGTLHRFFFPGRTEGDGHRFYLEKRFSSAS
jgi:hypothetical protein